MQLTRHGNGGDRCTASGTRRLGLCPDHNNRCEQYVDLADHPDGTVARWKVERVAELVYPATCISRKGARSYPSVDRVTSSQAWMSSAIAVSLSSTKESASLPSSRCAGGDG